MSCERRTENGASDRAEPSNDVAVLRFCRYYFTALASACPERRLSSASKAAVVGCTLTGPAGAWLQTTLLPRYVLLRCQYTAPGLRLNLISATCLRCLRSVARRDGKYQGGLALTAQL